MLASFRHGIAHDFAQRDYHFASVGQTCNGVHPANLVEDETNATNIVCSDFVETCSSLRIPWDVDQIRTHASYCLVLSFSRRWLGLLSSLSSCIFRKEKW